MAESYDPNYYMDYGINSDLLLDKNGNPILLDNNGNPIDPRILNDPNLLEQILRDPRILNQRYGLADGINYDLPD